MKHLRFLSLLFCFGFLLGIYRGKIAIWKSGDKNPAFVSPYSASLLPEADQKRLKDGIYFETESQLRKAVEDYLS